MSSESNDDRSSSSDEEQAAPGMPIFTTANSKPLDAETVVDILKNVDKYEAITCDSIPADPKTGNVFLFMPKTEADQGMYVVNRNLYTKNALQKYTWKS